MKKIFSSVLLAVGLLFSTSMWATPTVVTTASELQTALNAGGEIQLGAPIGGSTVQTVYTVPQNVSAVIDLNGQSITAGDGKAFEMYGDILFTIGSGATLEIKGSGTLDISNCYYCCGFLNSAATSTLKISPTNSEDILINTSSNLCRNTTGTRVITGGSYNKSPLTYIDQNNYGVTTVSNRYVVNPLPEICTVDGTAYKTIAAAMSAAKVDNVITYPIVLIENASYANTISENYTFDGTAFTLTITGSMKYIYAGTYNCSVANTASYGKVYGGTFNNNVTVGDGYICGGIFANEPADAKLATGYGKALVGGKYYVAPAANIDNNTLVGGAYFDDVTAAKAANCTVLVNSLASSTAPKYYVIPSANVEGGKVAKGVYTMTIPPAMVAEGYSCTQVKDGSNNSRYIIGQNVVVDNYKIVAGTFKVDPTAYVLNTTDFSVTENAGVWTVALIAGHGQAQIGATEYATVNAAISAAQSGDIVELKANVNSNVLIALKDITLDLNDYYIKNTSGYAVSVSYGTVIIKGGANSYIQGSSNSMNVSGNATFDSSFEGKIENGIYNNGGTLVIKGGHFKNGINISSYVDEAYTINTTAMEGYQTIVPLTEANAACKVVTTDNQTSYFGGADKAMTAWHSADGNKLVLLKDVSVSGQIINNTEPKAHNLVLDLNGKNWNSTAQYALELRAYELTIKSSKDGGRIYAWQKAITSYAGTTLNIESGIIDTDQGQVGSLYLSGALNVLGGTFNDVYVGQSATITGGNFENIYGSGETTTIMSDGYVSTSVGGVSVKGGEFGFDPSASCAAGYKATKISDSPLRYRVELDVTDPGSTDPTGAVVFIEGSEHYGTSRMYFQTLQGALNKAKTNDEVRLMQDITLNQPVQVVGNKTIYLHLEGFTLTNNVENALMCTVKDSTRLVIVGTPEGQSNAQLVIPSANTKAEGFFCVKNNSGAIATETLEMYNVTMTGATKDGFFILCQSHGANVKLQDVDANMTLGSNKEMINASYCNISMLRGTYTYASTYSSYAMIVNYVNPDAPAATKANAAVRMENVTVHSNKHVVIETMGDNNEFINCVFDVSDGSNHFITAGFSLSNGATATISSGTYIGGTGAYIYSSGGTLYITGGHIEGKLDDGSVGVAVHSQQNRNYSGDADAVMNITGGEFIGAIKVTAGTYYDAKMFISGGTFSSASFAVSGARATLEITGGTFDADPTAYVKSGYVVNSKEIESKTWYTVSNAQAPVAKTEIEWSNPEDWNTGAVPSASSRVSVPTNKAVTISSGTIAQALKIEMTGDATITVEEGAKLIVGKDGVSQTTEGENAPKIIVEDGGYLYISPEQADEHPFGTVKYECGAKKDDLKESKHIWQHIAIPTIAQPTIGLEAGYKTGADNIYLNTWDIMTGWKAIGIAAFNTPFQGYNFSNDATETGSVYTFAGNLVGSKVNTLVFAREGYTFFGNSYSAPINIRTMLQGFEGYAQRAVYIYNPTQESYATITADNAGKYAGFGKSYPSEIKPMQGFFVYCSDAAAENVNYQDAVWNFAMTVSSSPKRGEQMNIDGMAIQLTAANGRADIATLLEGAEYTEALKMENPATSVELYTVSSNGKMAIYAADNLNNTALGFRTNASVSYTIAFDNVTAEGYELVDQITGARTAIVDGATYTFNAAANTTIDTRMSIRKITDVVTNISEVKNASVNDHVYTVMGQFVGTMANWEQLPAGAYLVNGVKLAK